LDFLAGKMLSDYDSAKAGTLFAEELT